uniref:Geranylgeranylglycerol-phosphate geranylgeranyltransferase n=1 Tax=Candidatus Methanomethylicus mesodigestus TaxID=1867258 RepID=A0A7C3IXY3_9CREN
MTQQKSRSSATTTLRALAMMIRPVNCLMMGFAVVVGEVAILGGIPTPNQLVLGFSVSFLLTASSMIHNDVIDLEIDRINAPQRPLPSGMVSRERALIASAFFGITGILAALPLSWIAALIAILTFASSYAYNTKGKRLGIVGNVMVAFCIAMPFLFGGIVVLSTINVTVAAFFLLAFLSNIGREVTKGIADVEGDRTKGIMTVAVSSGEKKASRLAAAFYILPVMITPLPYLLGNLGMLYLVIVAAVDAGFIYSSLSILRSQTKGAALSVKRQVRYWMLLAMVAFLLGGIAK